MEICDRVENACLNVINNQNDNDTEDIDNSRLVLFLNILDYINMQRGEGDSARNVVFTIAKLISSSNVNDMSKLNAIKLLDLLVKNCGYPIHLHISRKGFLQVINNQFPPITHTTGINDKNSNNDNDNKINISNNYSMVQSALLKELNIWYHTICRWTSYKTDLVYIKHLYNIILDKGYLYPPLNDEELAILKPYSYIDSDTLLDHSGKMVLNIRSFEEFNNEQIIILNSKITELRRRGKEKDIMASDILIKRLKKFKSNIVTNEGKIEVLNRIENWNTILIKWDQKLDKVFFRDDTQSNKRLTDIENNKLNQFMDCLKQAQNKIQSMLFENICDDETFINKLFIFNDNILSFLKKVQSYHKESSKRVDENSINDIGKESERGLCLISLTTDDKCIEIDHLDESNVNTSIQKKVKSTDTVKQESLNIQNERTGKGKVEEIHEEKEKFNNLNNDDTNDTIEEHSNISKDGGVSNKKMVNEENPKHNSNKPNESFPNTTSILDTQRTHIGLMFKPKTLNNAPVITYAVSKAETSGQFKFDGNTNEITTHFKPFLDNP